MKKTKKTFRSKPVLVDLGDVEFSITITTLDGEGGHFKFSQGVCHIALNGDYPWGRIVGFLIHEVQEAIAFRLHLRFEKSDSYSHDNEYLFVWTHNNYSEITAQAGIVVNAAWDDLKEQWEARAVEATK